MLIFFAFIGELALIVGIIFLLLMKRPTSDVQDSEFIINSFESDNIAPKLTDMINYHKKHDKTTYKMKGR